MYQYLYLIPLGIIYFVLFAIVVPRVEGKGTKIMTALFLIPIAYFLTGFIDQYLPRWLYLFSKRFDF